MIIDKQQQVVENIPVDFVVDFYWAIFSNFLKTPVSFNGPYWRWKRLFDITNCNHKQSTNIELHNVKPPLKPLALIESYSGGRYLETPLSSCTWTRTLSLCSVSAECDFIIGD